MFFLLTNLFVSPLNSRELESRVCSYILSAAGPTLRSFWNSPPDLHEMEVKKQITSWWDYENYFDFSDGLKESWGVPASLDLTLRETLLSTIPVCEYVTINFPILMLMDI